jgi:hypothetical protein
MWASQFEIAQIGIRVKLLNIQHVEVGNICFMNNKIRLKVEDLFFS